MSLRPLDLHAHVSPSISSVDLAALNAFVFVATRTLDEAREALRRSDPWAVWGVGCHPGLVGAQKAFDVAEFKSLIDLTPYVAELGLDGRSRVPIDRQISTLSSALDVLQRKPRITSLHNSGATSKLLDVLTRVPTKGAVLHWWLGDEAETARAIDLGCYFSVNASMAKREEVLRKIPLDRMLTETDHPFGDRSASRSPRPGNVASVESAVARVHQLDALEVRTHAWRNLASLVSETRTASMLPRQVRLTLAAA